MQIFASTLPGLGDPGIPIAGSRAGAIGVLDLQYSKVPAVAEKQIEIIDLHTKQDFGVRLSGDSQSFPRPLLSRMPTHLKWVILTEIHSETLQSKVHLLREVGCTVLVEAVSIEEALEAERAGAQGIIAKGNEAGGRVAEETTFILLQRLLSCLRSPVYAHGGIGVHTAAACFASGAAGIVLDSQLALTREASIPEQIKARIAGFDGTETTCLGEEIGTIYRVCSRLGMSAIKKLNEMQRSISRRSVSEKEKKMEWRRAVAEHVGWDSEKECVFPLGQDVGFAASLAEQFVTVGGVVQGIRKAVKDHLQIAAATRVLDEGSPLALSHGTRYPIVQGPMARVSDTPRFILEVAGNGALPFLAAAWLRGHELDSILQETHAILKQRPWGVGMLGFLPPSIYKEQLNSVLAHRPPFALIGGGQPGQAKVLEKEGVATYLHVPSPGLLKMFLDEGMKRFVFEGRESGGHVGPLCSFPLWEKAIDLFLQHFPGKTLLQEYHVLFAGGIHDALSASMAAVLSARLAERGVRVGLQLGSAYLFTNEAVQTGAIVRNYQGEAIRCRGTRVLVTGPGDEERCIDTPFARKFQEEKGKLVLEGMPFEEMRGALQRLKLGRLRIASKGMARNAAYGEDVQTQKLRTLSEEEQSEQGLYLVGQLAGLRGASIPVQELHQEVSVKGIERILALQEEQQIPVVQGHQSIPSDVAVIGMACLFPKAPTLQKYWENILNKVNAIQEIPEDRWDWKLYYEADKDARDKVYSKWGAFLEDLPFDPTQYGMPPNSLSSIEPLQLLTLEVTKRALEDANYLKRHSPRDRTSVILGVSGAGDLAQLYGFRTSLTTFLGESAAHLVAHFKDVLPEWTEDSFPGILTNVIAGRIANRFDFRGTNFTVDAACASSLAAVYLAVRELETHSSDMVVVGGADCMQNPFTFMCFSKTQALSAKGQCSPLGAGADGITLGEGIAVFVFKRLADAERDGDRIYAVIKGVGSASDGKGKSLTAPSQEGQVAALQRAYEKSGISPATVGLIEAHATGTVVGDRTEVGSLLRVFKQAGAPEQSCAIGSVKSMIGHTKSAAGVASLMKAILALHHRVLPPTIVQEKPNPILQREGNPLYLNTETRPWMHPTSEHPRRAGVSAFGFGGTNFHVVLEEYSGDYLSHLKKSTFQAWPSELFVWSGHGRNALLEKVDELVKKPWGRAKAPLSNMAFACACQNGPPDSGTTGDRMTLAIVASSPEDLSEKLQVAKQFLTGSGTELGDPRGVYFTEKPLAAQGKVAFLFPGQGSQYINMLSDLVVQYEDVRSLFERSDRILQDRLTKPLSAYVFPVPAIGEDESRIGRQAIAQTQIAQPAMGTSDLAVLHLMRSLGVEPDMVAGHSYGEYVALCAAGVFSEEDLIRISEARARFILESVRENPGTMAAVNAPAATVEKMIEGAEGLWVANVNAPMQTIISGTRPAIENAVKSFTGAGIQARGIPVGCAFHSPIISPACERLKDFLSTIAFSKPRIQCFSNVNASPYSDEPETIRAQLVEHLVHRVEYIQEIEAMYREGARIFLEVGPGRVQTGLVDQILGDRAHLSVTANQPGRSGLVQLLHLLGQAAVHGIPVRLDALYAGRAQKERDLKSLLLPDRSGGISPTQWIVNGARALPAGKAAEGKTGRKITPVAFQLSSQKSDGKQAAITGRSAPNVESVPKNSNLPAETCGRAHASPTLSFLPGDEISGLMIQHQKMMQQFLETQNRVMLAYLNGTGMGDRGAHTGIETASPFQEIARPGREVGYSESEEHPLHQGYEVEKTTPKQEALPLPERKTLWDRQSLTAKLLEVVSERTGYPREMLNLDLDMEAELGIDSIKRVEILGYFLQKVLGPDLQGNDRCMEDLNRVKTLGKIIDHLDLLLTGAVSTEGEGPQEPSPSLSPDASLLGGGAEAEPPVVHLPRFTPRTVEAPPVKPVEPLASGRLILMTDDGRGIALALAERLRTLGNRVAIVGFDGPGTSPDPERYCFEDSSAQTIGPAVTAIRRNNELFGGIIHLSPLREWGDFNRMDLRGWRERLRQDVKTLFNLLQLLEQDLKQAPGGGFVVSATGMGGGFASDPALMVPDFFPGNGAIPGLLKTVAMEWPEIKIKAVDLELDEPVSDLADHLFAEMGADDGIVEVGYRGPHRLVPGLKKTCSADGAKDHLMIDSSWVILVTGGARGITAELALDLARRYQSTLLIAGRSPAPVGEESEDTSGLSDHKELKAALIRKMERQGRSISISDVQSAFRETLREREIRANLAAMRATGARVEYFVVDVSKEEEVGAFIEQVYGTHGRLDGVIHGAGIIEDKLLKEKSWESFERVFGTKTESAFILSRKLRPETLRFLIFFSSVAGRWGNIGQADYTAANDVLNKLAIKLNQEWPGRVVSIGWGPWTSGSGMVSEAVQKKFEERGVALISPRDGREFFSLEISSGRKAEPEVVVGEGPWKELTSLEDLLEHGKDFPLLDGASITREGALLVIERRLDPEKDLYLLDHRLNGKPVLPAAMAVELMSETVQKGWPEWKLTALREIKVLKGIVLEEKTKELRISALPKGTVTHGSQQIEIKVNITQSHQHLYSSMAVLERRISPPSISVPHLGSLEPFPASPQIAYRDWLFHGPRFQCIREIEGISRKGMIATLRPSTPRDALAGEPSGQWLMDPVVLDGGLQLALLWARNYLDITVLPSRFEAVRCLRPFYHSSLIRCCMQVLEQSSGQSVIYNMWFTDPQGSLLGMIERVEATGSKGLNRLVGKCIDLQKMAEPHNEQRGAF